jgi:hypothetical protein
MITRQDLIDNGYEDVLLIGDKDDDTTLSALIGISYDGRAIYDYWLLVEAFMTAQGWDEDTAIEWIEQNVTCTHFSEGNEPIFMTESFVNLSKKDPMEITW